MTDTVSKLRPDSVRDAPRYVSPEMVDYVDLDENGRPRMWGTCDRSVAAMQGKWPDFWGVNGGGWVGTPTVPPPPGVDIRDLRQWPGDWLWEDGEWREEPR